MTNSIRLNVLATAKRAVQMQPFCISAVDPLNNTPPQLNIPFVFLRYSAHDSDI